MKPNFELDTLCGSVKACIRLLNVKVCVVERIQLCPLSVHSSGEKASFQKGSPDICCIVVYGVGGTMLISCVNPKTEKKMRKAHSESPPKYSYLHLFKVKLSKHPFAYLYHDFYLYGVSTATVHIIYTLSVLKYLYIPKQFILTPYHFAIQGRECTQKAGASWKTISEKSCFLFHDYCLFVVLYKNNSVGVFMPT